MSTKYAKAIAKLEQNAARQRELLAATVNQIEGLRALEKLEQPELPNITNNDAKKGK